MNDREVTLERAPQAQRLRSALEQLRSIDSGGSIAIAGPLTVAQVLIETVADELDGSVRHHRVVQVASARELTGWLDRHREARLLAAWPTGLGYDRGVTAVVESP